MGQEFGMEARARRWALIDLHLHLDGSLPVGTVRKLAAMEGVSVPKEDLQLLAALQVGSECRDLNEYLEKFHFPCALLRSEAALRLAVSDLCRSLADQGLLYGEIRFAPQLHTGSGLSPDRIVRAAIAGLEESGFRGNLILCCMRGAGNEKENFETVETAARYLRRGVCAVDLAGAEALYETAAYEDLFRYAAQLGVPFTIHAGEADGPESVRRALAFGARRIGHGVRSVEDLELVARLAGEKITLELCPTSNLNTNVFDSLEQYPLLKLMDAGVPVTVNTDNLTVSGVTLASEFEKLIRIFHLTDEQLCCLVRNAVRASFADDETKRWLLEQIDNRLRRV